MSSEVHRVASSGIRKLQNKVCDPEAMLLVQDTHLENKRYFSAHSFGRNGLLALSLNIMKERRKVRDDK